MAGIEFGIYINAEILRAPSSQKTSCAYWNTNTSAGQVPVRPWPLHKYLE